MYIYIYQWCRRLLVQRTERLRGPLLYLLYLPFSYALLDFEQTDRQAGRECARARERGSARERARKRQNECV
jgi:hypothetical protein